MNNRQTYRIVCVSRALSPISHNETTAGNESVIARCAVKTATGVREVPWISGNTVRGVMVRNPGGQFLVNACGWAERMTKEQLNFVLHGGNIEKGVMIRNDTARQAEVRRLSPLLSLIGGCLPDQMLPGDLNVWHAALACRENEEYLRDVLGDGLPTPLMPAERFSDSVAYYRRDVEHGDDRLLAPKPQEELFAGARPPKQGKEAGDNRGMYTSQCVIAGAVFVHGFDAKRVTGLELGALLHSLAGWQAGGGTVGGQIGKGHGRLAMAMSITPAVDRAALMAAYEAHVLATIDDLTAAMERWFAPPKKAKKEAVDAA